MSDSLARRRIVVTGASSGIGAATARACAKAGARVLLLARRRDRLETLAEELNGAAVVIAADVRNESEVHRAVNEGSRQLGGLDGLVNAAGLNRAGRLAEGASTDWREMVETNLLGAITATHAVLPHFEEGGHADILNVSSMAAKRVLAPESAVYAATKAGLDAWSHALAQELGPKGIRVMVISPGMVRTEFATHTRNPTLRASKVSDLSSIGLDADVVAREIAHLLAQPPQVRIREMAIMPTAQRM